MIGGFNHRDPGRYQGTTTLITGASSGLGAEFAAQLARRGSNVVLVARREERLRELAARLERTHRITATVIAMDLLRSDAAPALSAALTERGITIDSLINNAGFGIKGAFAENDPTALADMVTLNVSTLTALTREFLPHLRSSGRGVLINIASTAAHQPTPGMAAYGASKAYVLSLTEALAYESRDSGLRVLCLSPGPTRTEFFDVVGTEDAAVGRFQTPAQVVSNALAELDRSHPRAGIVSGRINAISAVAARLAPRSVATAIAGKALK
ncbi:SDR family NAD(P)-dependent oxidoreductase [Gordonia sihwensis]|uniref:SDR family NAD(P)-dependent oxidoreductase n=1 Tax=Gordonia TaxID=2053 RepID=UPI00241710F8|nr:SDR family oxidoreductase [Gordonia sihwensis]WFN93035.1 SDR family oxidoreductase [Gordonia sihwensis]